MRDSSFLDSRVHRSLSQVSLSNEKQKAFLSKKQEIPNDTYCGVEITRFIYVISIILQEYASRNDKKEMAQEYAKVFQSSKVPSISIRDYLSRVVKYSNCSAECYIIALVYLDRVINKKKDFYISTLNIHKLLITSVMVAAKFFDDIYNSNAYFSKIGGVSNKEMNRMELKFLQLLDFQLHIHKHEFDQYKNEIQKLASQPAL